MARNAALTLMAMTWSHSSPRHLLDSLHKNHAGVIEKNVDGSPAPRSLRDHVLDFCFSGHVQADKERIVAFRLQLRDRLVAGVGIAIDNNHAGAFARKGIALARPMPLAAPVTMATLSFSFKSETRQRLRKVLLDARNTVKRSFHRVNKFNFLDRISIAA